MVAALLEAETWKPDNLGLSTSVSEQGLSRLGMT